MENGKAIPYSIDKLQDRGKFFVNLTMKFMKVKLEKIHVDDMSVNVTKARNSLTFVLLEMMKSENYSSNYFLIRRSFRIHSDEYVEVTPKSIRLRKIHLTETDRKDLKSNSTR
jgi:GTP-binding protein